jgi:hypothetical protein
VNNNLKTEHNLPQNFSPIDWKSYKSVNRKWIEEIAKTRNKFVPSEIDKTVESINHTYGKEDNRIKPERLYTPKEPEIADGYSIKEKNSSASFSIRSMSSSSAEGGFMAFDMTIGR